MSIRSYSAQQKTNTKSELSHSLKTSSPWTTVKQMCTWVRRSLSSDAAPSYWRRTGTLRSRCRDAARPSTWWCRRPTDGARAAGVPARRPAALPPRRCTSTVAAGVRRRPSCTPRPRHCRTSSPTPSLGISHVTPASIHTVCIELCNIFISRFCKVPPQLQHCNPWHL